MPETLTVEQMLQPFTATDSCRYSINHQWVKNGWRCATDSRIAVRVRTDEPDYSWVDERGHASRAPNMEGVFSPHMTLSGFLREFPVSPIIDPCGVCRNIGTLEVPCSKCGGDGEKQCHTCGHHGECGECEGSGAVSEHCPECHDVELSDGWKIDIKYWYRIAALPRVQILHNKEESLFKFDVGGLVGQGIVMHLKPAEIQ